jgi:predicted metal-dependent hydrolase
MTRKPTVLDPAQFALFEEPVPAAVAAPDEAAAPPTAPATTPSNPASPAPAVSIASVLSPAMFLHPQASREIRLDDHLVAYALKRVRRRSIGFIVGLEGLSVNAPKWVGVSDIEVALRAKGPWILRKLHEQKQRQQRLQASKVEWRDGTVIPFLGEPVSIVLDPRVTGAVLNSDESTLPGVARHTLHISLPHTASAEQIRDAVQSWLQRQAKRVFEERCQLYAQQLRVRHTRLSLSSAQTRWGSASADGSIRLNWRLIHFAMPTIDYVVVHELAHLREMNHSPKFWDVVRSVVPDYQEARGTLKGDVLPIFD